MYDLTRNVNKYTVAQTYIDTKNIHPHLHSLKYFNHREEILSVTKQQRERFECSKEPLKRARESQDYTILSLYVHLPPTRGQEVRTLELVQETSKNPFFLVNYPKRNLLVVDPTKKSVVIVYQNHKTAKHRGVDQTFVKVINLNY